MCDLDNYRGIALFNCICKLYDYVIIDLCEPQLRTSDLQFGFRENYSTIMCSLMNNINCNAQIGNVCKSAYFHLKSIGKARNMIFEEATAQVVHSLISSRIDYCNSLLYGMSDRNIGRLQKIQNTAILERLHWLKVKFRIKYKS